MYGPQQVGLVYKSKCHLPISDALTLDLEESYNRNSRYSKKHYHFSILLLHYVHPLLNAAQFQSLILVVFGSAGLWDNGPRFPPFCILAGAFCGALPALHLQVNVLQGDAMAWDMLTALEFNGVLGNCCPPNVLEYHITNLHR